MIEGLLYAGFMELHSLGDWAAFLLILAVIFWLGFFIAREVQNPLRWVSANRVALFVVIAALTGFVMSFLGSVELQGLRSSPYGIVSFELAKTEAKAGQIYNEWKGTDILVRGETVNALEQARMEIIIDMAFVVLYSLLYMLIFFWLAESMPGSAQPFFLTLGWAAPLAGILDYIENFAMLGILNGKPAVWLAQLAFWCALPKLFITLWFFSACIVLVLLFMAYNTLTKARN